MRYNFSHFKLLIVCILCFFILIASIQTFCSLEEPSLRCNASQESKAATNFVATDIPTLYLITPTYARPVQKADLTRLSQTLLHVPKLNWILVEDSAYPTDLITCFVKRLRGRIKATSSGLKVTHLFVETPAEFKAKESDPSWLKPRGVLQRNEGLRWLRENYHTDQSGIVYFADDDNTYDLELFDEMRKIRKVGCWPVGLVGGLLVERPLVKNGRVYGFNSAWRPERLFPIDMAGFAIAAKQLIRRSQAKFSLNIPRGFQESYILKQILTGIEELEPLAENCTKVLVWHTRTERPKLRDQTRPKSPTNI